MRINEIYKMPPTKNSSQGLATWAYQECIEKNVPILYQKDNIVIFKPIPSHLRYIVLQDQKPIFYLGLTKFADGYRTSSVATEPQARGQELGLQSYINASDILGVPLYSDTTQTDASRLGIWNKLIQQYPNRVVGYDQRANTDLNITMTDLGPAVNNNQPIYVDRKNSKEIPYKDRHRTRLLKLLPS